MHRLRVLCLLLVPLCSAQQAEDRVPLRDRIWIASKVYATILQYFGHWQAVPDLNLDAAYNKYLDKVAATDDRLAFDLATLELVAELRNGHSTFDDQWLWKTQGPWPGFLLDIVDGKWLVQESQLEGLNDGDVVIAIDSRATGQFISERVKYIAASEDRARRAHVFFAPYLWPKSFTVTLEGGRTLSLNRLQPKRKPRAAPPPGPPLPDGVAYHRIPSFNDPKFENLAIDFVKANAHARLIIFDVRGNGGGSSPEILLRAIMDRPYRDWMQASAMSFGLFASYGEQFHTLTSKDTDERTRGYLEGFSEYFQRPYFMTPGALKPVENPVYTGPIYVLQDHYCASACEDFVMPLKTSHRARVFGERSFGSSGQPQVVKFANGMELHISTKRMYFPDGSEFEGVGIQPDVEILPAPGVNRDVVLEAAIKAYSAQP